MNIHTYPGQGLSLSQLVFALNEEVKRVAYSSSFTFDTISQLDQDASTALATIREWRNSFIPINRLPTEILSLIPTHLFYEDDRLNASYVCHHWRKTLIQNAALWNRLNLTIRRSDFFVETILERSKGFPLDISTASSNRAEVLALLSPHAQQFKTLKFVYSHWSDIQRFSEAVPGPFPLLHTLNITAVEFDAFGPETMNPPSLPLFTGAVNLKKFILRSAVLPFLDHFTFPNLTTFELSSTPEDEEFPVSQLLDFLGASPTLQAVCIRIEADIFLGDVPPERVVVLPNVEKFSITQDVLGYGVAAHISCPSARLTSLVHENIFADGIPQEVFPASVSWDAIAPQYLANTIDEVVLGISTAGDALLACSISFTSPGPATLELGYRMIAGYEGHTESQNSLGEKHSQGFSQALMAIRKHPLLSNVKNLRILDRHVFLAPHHLARITSEVAQLFKSVGPLEELILDVDDLRQILSPFFDLPESADVQPDVFPPIKALTIAKRSGQPLDEECMAAIVKLAKSQHALGVPFEHVVFRMKDSPVAMVVRLSPWVGMVHFGEGTIVRDELGNRMIIGDEFGSLVAMGEDICEEMMLRDDLSPAQSFRLYGAL